MVRRSSASTDGQGTEVGPTVGDGPPVGGEKVGFGSLDLQTSEALTAAVE